ncbi:MAG: DUF2306 domain-containing protein [Planctomycetota bacterium]|nr:DUF2306 domain-containing protein [Planctomycetota bacterium]
MKRAAWAWGLMTFFALAVGAYALAVVAGLVSTEFLAKFTGYRGWANLHFFGGGLALLLGPWQFNKRLRARRLQLHRGMGRVYLLAVAGSAVAGLFLATRATGGFPAGAGFAGLGTLWLLSAILAFTSIKKGRVEEHRRWMTRNFALTYAAVTLRFYLPLSQIAGLDFETAYTAIAWLCWVPNLILIEWVFLAPRARRVAT